MMSYKSPIEIIEDEIEVSFQSEIMKAVQSYGIYVDKDELIKALNYDRGQYQKGYDDAKDKYEKALDKICDFLARGHTEESGWNDKDKWKEWCLNEID